jgi:hypothetical protein
LQGEKLGLDDAAEPLYVGAMNHDIGLVEGHRSEHQRVEIDGGTPRGPSWSATTCRRSVMTVWEPIAVHTTPEIPRYKQPEVRGVTLGVEYDVRGLRVDEPTAHQRKAVLVVHPRPGFKRHRRGVPAGMRDKPDIAFATMNTDILEATVPGYVRPNFCDYIRDSRFDT